MAETYYHIRVKKEYAAALIEDLIKVDALEDLQMLDGELPQWQKDILDKELKDMEDGVTETYRWEDVKKQFV